MVYQINVRIDDSKLEEFLKIIESFKKIGLVNDYNSQEKEEEKADCMQDEELLKMIQTSRQQIADGKGLSTNQAKEKVKTRQKP